MPEEVIDGSYRQWKGLVVVVRSLGWRVPMDWISKEVRLKANLVYEPEIFALPEDHFVLWLRSKADCSLMKLGGSWFVARHLLAIED